MVEEDLCFDFYDIIASPGKEGKLSNDEALATSRLDIASQSVIDESLSCDINIIVDQALDSDGVELESPLSPYRPQQKASSLDSTGLGRWIFDKKRKLKQYIALTGEILCGPDATKRCRSDVMTKKNSRTSARKDMEHTMKARLPYDESALNSFTALYSNDDLRQLSLWGLPRQLVARYHDRGVTSLFDWQVDCLLADRGRPLLGNNLVNFHC